jgi:hypothetical protein
MSTTFYIELASYYIFHHSIRNKQKMSTIKQVTDSQEKPILTVRRYFLLLNINDSHNL